MAPSRHLVVTPNSLEADLVPPDDAHDSLRHSLILSIHVEVLGVGLGKGVT